MPNLDEIEAIALAISQAFNDREFDRGLAFLAPGFEMTNMATGAVYRGVEGFRRDMEYWSTGFPDCHCDVTSVIVTNDRAVVEFVARGTHTGPLVNPGSTIAPTGRKLEMPNCEVYEIEDGKLVRGRAYYDADTVRRQLRLPADAPAGAAG
jgi:steroid delta-isomerase-like uncharacterized protein